MHDFQLEFIHLALEVQALKFGNFTLKSGRQSPYFFNAGAFHTGKALCGLGSCFAKAMTHHDLKADMLFGPAYKGIPLATAMACALGDGTPVAFNRKEAKTHGEGGTVLGAPIQGDVLIIDDVISAGTAKLEAKAFIEAQGGNPTGILVALDRQELGAGSITASKELSSKHGLPVYSIITLDDLLDFIKTEQTLAHHLDQMKAYWAQHRPKVT